MNIVSNTPGSIDNCAVCLYFDISFDTAIRRIWNDISVAGMSSEMPEVGWRPHVTLSGCRDLRIEEYSPLLQEFTTSIKPIDISFTNVGYFGTGDRHTLFFAPTITRELLDLHERHHGLVVPFCSTVSPYYTPRHWVPHCTLALNLSKEALARAVLSIDSGTLPITGKLEAVGLVHVARPHIEALSLLALC